MARRLAAEPVDLIFAARFLARTWRDCPRLRLAIDVPRGNGSGDSITR